MLEERIGYDVVAFVLNESGDAANGTATTSPPAWSLDDAVARAIQHGFEIFIASGHRWREMERELQRRNFQQYRIFTYELLLWQGAEKKPDFFADTLDVETAHQVADLMQDDGSKGTYLALTQYRRERRYQLHSNIEQYLGYYKPKPDDVILDVGAAGGETTLRLAAHVPKGKIYAFEPDGTLFAELEQRTKHLGDLVFREPRGCWSESGALHFDTSLGARANHFTIDGTAPEVEVIAIDHFIEREGLNRVDMIKMDIEGGELPALKGALQLIKSNRPALVISIYHSNHDFVHIPLWINGLDLGYRLYLDHHGPGITETVLYALPAKD